MEMFKCEQKWLNSPNDDEENLMGEKNYAKNWLLSEYR